MFMQQPWLLICCKFGIRVAYVGLDFTRDLLGELLAGAVINSGEWQQSGWLYARRMVK
jgi:hypothetical protein